MAECLCPESKKHIVPKQNNYLEEFRQDCIRPSESGEIRGIKLLEAFEEWYKLRHAKQLPKYRELFDYVTKYYENDKSVYKKINNWYGLELITHDDNLF